MRTLCLCILFMIQAQGSSTDNNNSKSCHKMLKEIKVLEDKKKENIYESVGVFFFGGTVYTQSEENEKIETKIKILRLRLNGCE